MKVLGEIWDYLFVRESLRPLSGMVRLFVACLFSIFGVSLLCGFVGAIIMSFVGPISPGEAQLTSLEIFLRLPEAILVLTGFSATLIIPVVIVSLSFFLPICAFLGFYCKRHFIRLAGVSVFILALIMVEGDLRKFVNTLLLFSVSVLPAALCFVHLFWEAGIKNNLWFQKK